MAKRVLLTGFFLVLGGSGWLLYFHQRSTVQRQSSTPANQAHEDAQIILGQGPPEGNALPDEVLDLLRDPDEMELLSLKPFSMNRDGRAKWGSRELFHQMGVVGKVLVKNHTDKKMVVESITGAVNSAKGVGAGCFLPHHGLRVRKGKRTVDFVICFTCKQLHFYTEKGRGELIIAGAYSLGRELDLILLRGGAALQLDEE